MARDKRMTELWQLALSVKVGDPPMMQATKTPCRYCHAPTHAYALCTMLIAGSPAFVPGIVHLPCGHATSTGFDAPSRPYTASVDLATLTGLMLRL